MARKARHALLVTAVTKLLEALPGLAPTFLVVALLACVLVPLPTPLVDLLLSLSMAGSVLLLVASLGVKRTTDFINFPTLLLLATLYRLALNVSTTRLILSEADAGRVVDAFATFVVRDDLIVGGVMFAIITVVQYVVIARGAERVAEVAARFALDGLPGHQSAIDADLRAGVISAREASHRRALLAERSNFYGAMDGAVRFVKGDAIAGLVITGVNLLGGMAIGMGREGLGWEDSLMRFGRLTVGDGLISQIPALLLSLAAGVLVARIDRQQSKTAQGGLSWLDPAMLFVPAFMLFALALVPEMPSLAFVTVAVLLCSLALGLSVQAAGKAPVLSEVSSRRTLTVHIAPGDLDDRGATERVLAEVHLRCGDALGIAIPRFELYVESGRECGVVEILLDDRHCARVRLGKGQKVEDKLVLALFRAVMNNAGNLIDLQDLDQLIETVRETHPVVVQSALKVMDLSDVLAVARGFVRERIRLPPMRILLGALAEDAVFRERSERKNYPELARRRLAEYWIFAELEGLHRLGAPIFVRLTPDAEEELLEHYVSSVGGDMLTLSPKEKAAWVAAMANAGGGDGDNVARASESMTMVAGISGAQAPMVLVTTPRARQAAALLVSGVTPRLPVLSTWELEVAKHAYTPRWVSEPV